MAYYIYVENEKINGCGECQQLTENVQNVEVIETLYNDFAENPNKYIYKNGEIVINPNYEQEQAQKERERLNLLSMTKREMFLGLYQAKGITPDMLKSQITDPQALIEFDYANDYYRGNPLIDVIGGQLGFTTEQLDKFFETKDYHYLTNCNIKVTLRADEKPETEPIVTINGVETKETTLPYGSTCTIKVECDGYKTLEPEDFTVTEDMHIELQLIKEEQATDISNEVGE